MGCSYVITKKPIGEVINIKEEMSEESPQYQIDGIWAGDTVVFAKVLEDGKTIKIGAVVWDEVKKEFPDATHNCYAWKIGYNKKSKYRYSDDGEPNNTAGLPIFKVITARKLTNVIVVVTRYFGGIKLGTGGLIRTYSKAAMSVLKQCEIEKIIFMNCYVLWMKIHLRKYQF